MGISAIVHIADRLLSRSATEDQDNPPQAKNATQTGKGDPNRTDFGDQFTQSGAANGTGGAGEEFLTAEFFRFTAFAVQTGAATNAAAAAPAGQTTTTQSPTAGTQALTVGQTANPTGAAAANAVNAVALTATTVPVATPVATAAAAAPIVAATPTATAPAATTAAATNIGTNQTQAALQALNSSLSALGLNAAEIAAFDQFATLLLQIDPNGLQELQNELNLLATRYQEQGGTAGNAAQAAAPATTPAQASTPNATSQVAAPATQPGFQLSELSVTFSSITSTKNLQNGGTQQLSAVSLQIQEINVTLGTPSGQTAQIQVSPNARATAAATPATPAAAPQAAKIAAA